MNQLIIKKSDVHGKGVFASADIPLGTKLVCDILKIPKINIPTELEPYLYPFDKLHKSICIGFGNFFNHSETHNIKIHELDKINMTKTFIVLSDIKENSELFLYYNDSFNTELKSNV